MLAAAALVAVALAPVVVAYLQLGYHGDLTASEEYESPGENADRLLARAVHDAGSDAPADFAWDDRDAAVESVRIALEPRLDALRSSRVESGTVYRVGYNQSAAEAWRAANCPGGPDRQFGDCKVRQGVVIQERAGRTHVLAVAFDMRVISEDAAMERTVVVPSVG